MHSLYPDTNLEFLNLRNLFIDVLNYQSSKLHGSGNQCSETLAYYFIKVL